MKKFRDFLREHVMKIINFKKKKMTPLTNEQQDKMKREKSALHLQKNSDINTLMIKITVKLKTIVIILVNTKVGAEHNICNLKYMYLKTFLWSFTID